MVTFFSTSEGNQNCLRLPIMPISYGLGVSFEMGGIVGSEEDGADVESLETNFRFFIFLGFLV
jgi:hypothetical protein